MHVVPRYSNAKEGFDIDVLDLKGTEKGKGEKHILGRLVRTGHDVLSRTHIIDRFHEWPEGKASPKKFFDHLSHWAHLKDEKLNDLVSGILLPDKSKEMAHSMTWCFCRPEDVKGFLLEVRPKVGDSCMSEGAGRNVAIVCPRVPSTSSP